MAKVRQLRSLSEILQSEALAIELEKIGRRVLEKAQSDPDPAYVASLSMHRFVTDRVRVQVGAAPGIGKAVEAKRGTLSRALGAAGD